MKFGKEVLFQSFGNGVAMLRFQKEQTSEDVAPFVANLGMPASEFVIGERATEVFVLLEEGHPVTSGEARNSEDDWDALVAAVSAEGSEAFQKRVSRLGEDRTSLLPSAPPS